MTPAELVPSPQVTVALNCDATAGQKCALGRGAGEELKGGKAVGRREFANAVDLGVERGGGKRPRIADFRDPEHR